ncbi:MAG TPA: glycosyltransferase [Haliangium sp.]|nr:glycosyltransferase [Haliangium sp.]
MSPEALPEALPDELPGDLSPDRPTGGIVCPAYNESVSLNGFVREVEALVAGSDTLSEFRMVLSIVDDGSADDTASVARSLAQRSSDVLRVETISLTRNFGQ